MTAPFAPPFTSPAPSDPSDVVGRDVLIARITLLEQSVRAAGHVPVGEMEAARPGGIDNPDTTAMGLLHYLCVLHRMDATGPTVRERGKGAAKWNDDAMDAVRAALAREPRRVRLTVPGEWAVHQKGEYALHRCAVLDVCLTWLAVRRLALEEAIAADQVTATTIETLRQLVDLQARMDQEYAWLATTPGPDVPWPESAGWEPEIPAVYRTFDVTDHLAIRQAFVDVNLATISAIAERTKAMAAGGAALPLPAFLGIAAGEMQVQPSVAIRQWTLGELFAMTYMRWEAQERAEQAAKDDAPKD